MPTDHEVERLKRVYRTYRESEAIQAQWDSGNPGNRAILGERQEIVEQLLKTQGFLPLSNRRVLEIGCGSGNVLASFLIWGARPENLYGIDLLPDRIEKAQRLYPNFHFRSANAEKLDFPDDYFHLLLFFTVFSSILDEEMAHNVAREAIRVLRPNGAILWYDFRYNNPRNPYVRGMTRRDIRRLFPGFELHLKTITLLPPLSRRLGRLTPVLYPLLAAIPPLRTHYLGLLVKPE